MSEHRVCLELPEVEIKRIDAKFSVYADEEKFGTLEVSKGTLVWFPRGTEIGKRISWEKFDDLMREHAADEERR
jgi:hypothetical protein